jgi:hypothetical protein
LKLVGLKGMIGKGVQRFSEKIMPDQIKSAMTLRPNLFVL